MTFHATLLVHVTQHQGTERYEGFCHQLLVQLLSEHTACREVGQ